MLEAVRTFRRREGEREESEHFMMNAENVCGKVYQDLLPQSSGGGCYCGQGNSNVWSRFITESHPLATDRCDGFPPPPLMDSPTEYTTGQDKKERIKAKGLAGVEGRKK